MGPSVNMVQFISSTDCNIPVSGEGMLLVPRAADFRIATTILNENLYSPHNIDSSSDKINTKLYNKKYLIL